MSDFDLMLRFMIQVMVVLGACRLVGWLGTRFLGQTQVVMEMATGVVLGPSLFGQVLPEAQAWLFPQTLTVAQNGVEVVVRHPSMSILYVIAQIGLVFYMFLVGLDLDVKQLRGQARGMVTVSIAGITTPFVLGGVVAYAFSSQGLFTAQVSLSNQILYMGAAMAITAFPMLARILHERGIAGTRLGTLALGAGATADAAAWCLLAVVLAALEGNWYIAAQAIGGGLLYAVMALSIGRKRLARLNISVERDQHMSHSIYMAVVLAVMAGAWFTDVIGIHAVFGAFLVGVSMPRGLFASEIRDKTESMMVSFLLPFFFVYSGLNTQLSLLDSPSLWLMTGIILSAAIAGKGIACALAARYYGMSWRESWAIGTLMNARGLMELIILNIGLQQGVITPMLFTVMVVMAIVTTLMTSPLFLLLHGKHVAEAQ